MKLLSFSLSTLCSSECEDGADQEVSIAVNALALLGEKFDDFGVLEDLLTIHSFHGSCTTRLNTKVYCGVIVPVEISSTSRQFEKLWRGEQNIFTGVAVIDGDISLAIDLEERLRCRQEPWDSINVVFVGGHVDARFVDYCLSFETSVLVVPVASSKILTRLASLSQAIIAGCWEEILPECIGRIPIRVSRIDTAAAANSEWVKDDEFSSLLLQVEQIPIEDSKPTFQHASVLIQGPTRWQAAELQLNTLKAIRVLRSATNSFGRGVVPAAGSYLCAIASVIEQAGHHSVCGYGEHHVLSRIADSFRRLCAMLLETCNNEDSRADDSYFSRLATVRTVERQFTEDIESIGAEKLFETYNFKSRDYNALSLHSRRSILWRADGAVATEIAIQQSFRVVRLLASVADYTINAIDGYS